METKHKNITRYTYENTSFLGWRVAVYRKGHVFYKYFSDKYFGGAEKSLEAALTLRERILSELSANPDDYVSIFDRFRNEK